MDSGRIRRIVIALTAAYSVALHGLLLSFVPLSAAALTDSLSALCAYNDTGSAGYPVPHDIPCVAICAAMGHGMAGAVLPAVAEILGLGFVAAVIKEFSSRVSDGPAAIFTNWSVYVLIVVGAAAMLLASHAVAAGPLAASQPGFTIGDPVTAVLLGFFVFGERLGTSPGALAAEVFGLIVLAAGVLTLSGSWLIIGAESGRADCKPVEPGEQARHELTRRSR